MSCRKVIEFLGAYLSGELSPLEKFRFDAHLALCRQCRQYLKSYRETILLAKSAGDDSPEDPCETIPEDLVQAILKARSNIEDEAQPGSQE